MLELKENIISIIVSIIIIISVAISIAYTTLAERKIIGSCQRRNGPNKNGRTGIIQPISDASKLAMSEIIIPIASNKISFIGSSLFIFIVGLAGFLVLTFSNLSFYRSDNLSILYILVCNSLIIFGVLFAGLSSNSKYSILGAIRATSSMISYEISLGLIIIGYLYGTSYNISELYNNYSSITGFLIYFVSFIMYINVIIAELGRVPFDLIEAESELTAGPYTEYSAMMFAKFFLVEYGALLFHSFLCNTLFNIKWSLYFSNIYLHFFLNCTFSVLILSFAIILRATLPRVKWDQLITLNWLYILPASLSLLFVIFFSLNLFCF